MLTLNHDMCLRTKANVDWDSLGFGLKDVAGVRILPHLKAG